MSMDKETERLFAMFRPDMLKDRLRQRQSGQLPDLPEEDLFEDGNERDDAMTVAEFREGMEKFDQLLAQLAELQSKFVGIIKGPPAPVIFPKKISSFEEFVAGATGYSKYKSCYEKARATEVKINDSKLHMFAFLYYVKNLKNLGESFYDYTADQLYDMAFKEIPQVIAVWRIHSRDLGIPIEEYINKHVKI